MPSQKSSKKKKKSKKKSSRASKTKIIVNKDQQRESMIKSMLCDCVELFFSILAIAIIGTLYQIFWDNSPLSPLLEPITENTVPKIYNIYSNEIETVLWSDINGETHLDKMLNIGRKRKPILIKKAPCIYWKANRMWKLSKSPQKTIEYLSKLHYENNLKFHFQDRNLEMSNIENYNVRNDIVTVYRMNNSNFFTFQDKTRSFMTYDMVSNDKYNMNDIEMINVSFIDFLGYINNKKYSVLNVNNSYLYYVNSARNVYSDIKPIHWFKMKDKTVYFTENHIRELTDMNEINLEISPTRLFINSYYDITHNFYYQIEGIRRILLSPPSETIKLHSFPEGHPSYKSSQIPFKFYFIPFDLWISRNSYPFKPQANKQNINAWNIELHEGDLLYVPPFYWTQITTVINSISISSKSLGFEQIFASLSDPNMLPKVLHKPNMNDVDQQKYILHQLAFFTRSLIDRILKALPDQRDNINDNENENKSELLSEFNDELEWDIIHQWITKQLINGKYKGNLLWDDMQCSYFDPIRCPKYGNTTQSLMKDMEQTAKTWAFAYKQIKNYVPNKNDMYYIRNVMLSTHIEQFVSYIAGHLNYCYFLQCLVNERFGSLYVESQQEEMQRKMEQRMREQKM